MVAEVYCLVTEPAGTGNDRADDAVEKRRARRRQVLKRGQLVFGFGGSTVDCLIIDETTFGVQLETSVMTDLPDNVRVRFVGGATFDALRRWATGNRVGLEFMGSQIYDEVALRRRKAVAVALKNQGVNIAVHMLRDEEFFKNDELRSAAEGGRAGGGEI